MVKNELKSKHSVILVYTLVFYGIWSFWEFWGNGVISRAVADKLLAQFIKSGIVKGLIWTLPAVCLVRYYQDDVYVQLKQMFTNRVNILKYIPVFIGFSVYLVLGAFVVKGGLAISESFNLSDLVVVLFVGITEEMVFRGWLLNGTVNKDSIWLPVVINALLFLLIHFPIWIKSGQIIDIIVSLNFLAVPILSVIFSWTFLKSKSIWIPIVLHMYWDLFILLFY